MQVFPASILLRNLIKIKRVNLVLNKPLNEIAYDDSSIVASKSISSRTFPVPVATLVNGSSA